MKPRRTAFVVALILIFTMGACGPRPASPAAPVPPADTPVPASTEPPAPTAAEAAATEPAAPAAAIAGPVMEVGSTYSYFDGSLLVAVPAGAFTMGAGGPDNPIRTVELDDFWIYEVEVTNRMYAACVAVGRCSPPDADDNPGFSKTSEANKPVVGVNWGQAVDYCTFANGRLPTEAEWEKAARGPDGNIYPWGNKAPECSLLNFDACVYQTTLVGTYPEGMSFYKALDMAGNVFEWVADWYEANYYASASTQNPEGPSSGNERSIRSSAFNSDGYLTEVARRFHANPNDHRADLGFRCVVEDPAGYAPLCTQLLVYGKPGSMGQGTGEVLTADCNKPEVKQALVNCQQTNLTINPGNGPLTYFDIDTANCKPVNNEWQWWCKPGASWVKICGDCKIDKPSEVSCPAGYHQDGKRCVIDQGRPGICPPGSLYDETQLCCTPQPGQGYEFPLCASWASFYQGQGQDDSAYCFKGDFPGRFCWSGPVQFKQGCGVPRQPDCDEDPTQANCGEPCTGPDCEPDDGCTPATGAGCSPNCNSLTGAGCVPIGVCLAGATFIDTPSGQISVEQLRVGDAVWSLNSAGARVRATILKTTTVPTQPGQPIMHIALEDGRELWASPGHPTTDGRTLGELVPGDNLDQARVIAADRRDNLEAATYDLLPSGETGYYWANGILLGSTISGP